MPFPIVFQINLRAFLWIILFSAEVFASAIFKMVPVGNWIYFTLLALFSLSFLVLSYLEDDELVRDMRDITLYEISASGIGIFFALGGVNPSYVLNGILGIAVFLRYGRLLWPSKTANGERFVEWPVFGILGWRAKRKNTYEGNFFASPTLVQARHFYTYLVLCLIAGFALPEIGINFTNWHVAIIAFFITPVVAKSVLTDMKCQHAAYLQSLEDAAKARERAAAEQARADAQQEIAAEKERSNQQLAGKNAEIEALLAEQAKDKALLEKFNDSLRDAAHDLQHPMAVVRIHADALAAMSEEEFWDKEKWRDVAQKLDFAMEEMTDMIDATVHSAQVVTGIIKPDVRVIDMTALLKKFMELWFNGPNRRGLDHLIVYPAGHAGLYCPFDLMVLKRILRNLIANAIQHSAPESGILIALRRRGGRCIVEVRDSGPGIPEGLGLDKRANFAAFALRIREEGSQVKQSGSRSGYRLGMSNVLQLCVATELEMQLCTKPGRGSMFAFSLPLANADQFTEARQMRMVQEAQWEEASQFLAAYNDLPMPEGDFFPKDDDLAYHNLMPSSPNGVNGTPGK